jgi:two-component system invasion response regulator UvrY
MGIEVLLNAQKNFTVVGVANSGEQALIQAQELTPNVILMDIKMPGIGGIEASKRLLHHFPRIKIIILSVHNDGPMLQQLFDMGVMGFLSKDSAVDEMVKAIKVVDHGKRYICTKVGSNLAISTLKGYEVSPFENLSSREIAVLMLVLEGREIREIAKTLLITNKTVNTYRYRLYQKLQIKNDVELTRLAIKYGFIEP